MQRSPIQRAHYTSRNDKNLKQFTASIRIVVVSDFLHVGSGNVGISSSKIEEKDIEDFIKYGKLPNVSITTFKSFSRAGGKIVIPGSTIKGLVRSRLELSLPQSCYIVDAPSTNSSATYVRIFHPVQKHSDRFDPEKFPNVCPVCDLLGNMGLGSRVSFSDAVLLKGETAVVNDLEVVKKGAEFQGSIRGLIKNEVEVGMVFYGLGIRPNGNKVVLLGRFKYSDRRFGRVKATVTSSNFDVSKSVSAFINAYRPKDFNEEW